MQAWVASGAGELRLEERADGISLDHIVDLFERNDTLLELGEDV